MRLTPRTVGEWGSVAPQWLGILGLLACFVVWVATHQVEPAFLTAFGGLIVVGQGAEAMAAMRQAPPTPPPVPDKTVQDRRRASAEATVAATKPKDEDGQR